MDGRDLKIFNARTSELVGLRRDNDYLRNDRKWLRLELYHANQRFSEMREQIARLTAENQTLASRVDELTMSLRASSSAAAAAAAAAAGDGDEGAAAKPPAFVKASVPSGRRRKKPGRKAGHPAALRPMPEQIDVHQDAPLPTDPQGRAACPRCNACLLELEAHERIVEDIVPAKVVVTCYHTASGWCPGCRKRVESRANEQPPAANLVHGQLGINALATGVLLRITHRLPFRQVSKVFADLPGLSVSPGAVARQVQRIADWLEKDYQHLLLQLRSSPHVHADETGWRTDGKNGYLWAVATPTQTLYHIDAHRSGEVIQALLGKAFGGTLITDFYSAYSRMDCKKQKCLVHLLRELTESAEKSERFKNGRFFRTAKRLVKEMLLLKGRWDQIGETRYAARVIRLEQRLDQLADDDDDDDDDDEPHAKRLGARLRRHRKELTAFLWDKDLAGTNNTAERAIRPMVVARKISGGSRSDKGATAFAKVASLLRTAGQQGNDLLSTIKRLLVASWAERNPAVATDGD